MIRAVLFDLDGTLLDTPRLITEAITVVLSQCGVAPMPAEVIRATIGLRLDVAFGKLMNKEPDDELVTTAVAHYRTLFTQEIVPQGEKLVFPGVREGLQQLRADGIVCAIATSKAYASAHILLQSSGLRGVFDCVVGADQVKCLKPDPEMANHILKELRCETTQAILVGDTSYDVLMAQNAGLRSIAVTYGVHDVEVLKKYRPTWMAENFNQVISHIYEKRRGKI